MLETKRHTARASCGGLRIASFRFIGRQTAVTKFGLEQVRAIIVDTILPPMFHDASK